MALSNSSPPFYNDKILSFYVKRHLNQNMITDITKRLKCLIAIAIKKNIILLKKLKVRNQNSLRMFGRQNILT
jgi:hypothetical protein